MPWMITGLAGGSLGILIVALAPSIPVVLAGWCVAQLFFNALLAAMVAVMPDQVPSVQRGLVSGVLGVCLPGRRKIFVLTASIVYGLALFVIAVASDFRRFPGRHGHQRTRLRRIPGCRPRARGGRAARQTHRGQGSRCVQHRRRTSLFDRPGDRAGHLGRSAAAATACCTRWPDCARSSAPSRSCPCAVSGELRHRRRAASGTRTGCQRAAAGPLWRPGRVVLGGSGRDVLVGERRAGRVYCGGDRGGPEALDDQPDAQRQLPGSHRDCGERGPGGGLAGAAEQRRE